MFLSRRHRPNDWPFYVLLGFEIPLTIALLALFGIAAPNLYRTKLWQDGADNGFNSSPVTGLYAYANYQPYTTPKVWSQFITNYNIVIVVLSMFIGLVKSIMYILHVWPPIMSVLVHAVLIALYTVSVYYQASSDTTDPDRPQNGPAWYITKSCSVTRDKKLVGYCQQAKASFAATVAILGMFAIYFAFGLWSCFPSKSHREEYYARKRERDEKYSKLEAIHEEAKSARSATFAASGSGGLNPMTPRTMAFNTLGGTKDLPLRNHFSSPGPVSPQYQIRSPTLPRSPMNLDFEAHQQTVQTPRTTGPLLSPPPAADKSTASPMYFPPPPKKANKK